MFQLEGLGFRVQLMVPNSPKLETLNPKPLGLGFRLLVCNPNDKLCISALKS